MLKKTITYTDFNGDTHTEDFYFNLNKAELIEMQMSEQGGFENYLKRAVEAKDGKTIMSTFKDIILMSYGERSEDGKRFIKSDEARKAFSETEAYSTLFVELVTNADEAVKFANGIVPPDLVAEAAKEAGEMKKPSDFQKKQKVTLAQLNGQK